MTKPLRSTVACTASGAFERVNEPSAHLRTLLLRAGIPWNELTRIVGHDA